MGVIISYARALCLALLLELVTSDDEQSAYPNAYFRRHPGDHVKSLKQFTRREGVTVMPGGELGQVICQLSITFLGTARHEQV